jgi:hypothetical protein
VKGRPLPPELEDRVDPMFEQPVLGLLMLALDAYGTRAGAGSSGTPSPGTSGSRAGPSWSASPRTGTAT